MSDCYLDDYLDNVLAVVNGRVIRRLGFGHGSTFVISGTGHAFVTVERAISYARTLAATEIDPPLAGGVPAGLA